MEIHTNDTEDPPSSHILIIQVSVPCIVLLGLVGNALTILVLTHKHFKDNATSIFLTALAVSDSIYLLTNIQTNTWISYVSTVNVRESSDTACKLLMWVVYASKGYGSWTLVVVNLQRFLLVAFPLKAKLWLTVARAKLTAAFLLAVTLLVSSYALVLAAVSVTTSDNIGTGCRMSINPHTVRTLNIFSLVYNGLLPCVFIVTSNGLLFHTLKHGKHCSMSNSDSLGLTITLVTLSVTYMGLTLPVSFMILYNSYQYDIVKTIPYYRALFSALHMLDLTNSAINFILYCLSGQTFRAQMKQMVHNALCNCYCRENRVTQAKIIKHNQSIACKVYPES